MKDREGKDYKIPVVRDIYKYANQYKLGKGSSDLVWAREMQLIIQKMVANERSEADIKKFALLYTPGEKPKINIDKRIAYYARELGAEVYKPDEILSSKKRRKAREVVKERRAKARRWLSHTKTSRNKAEYALVDSYVEPTGKSAISAKNRMLDYWTRD